MAYLSETQLKRLGFKRLGSNVKISDKASIYNCDQIIIGNNSRIDDFCVISGQIEIGAFVHITPQCLVAGGVPGIFIEDYCTLAYGVKIFAQSDDYSGETMANSLISKKFKNEIFKSVRISRLSIIGAASVVMPGANIAEGVSVGAQSLVLQPTVEWKIYAGIPAKVIGERSKRMLDKLNEFENSRNDTI